MPIPDHVHPMKLFVACFGIDPRKPPPSLSVSMQTLCHALEIPPLHVSDAIELLRTQFAPLGRKFNSSEAFLNPEPLIDKAIDIVKTATLAISKNNTRDLLAAGGDWINSKLRVDIDNFNQLLGFTIGRLQAFCYPQNSRPDALRELDEFCDSLITAAPRSFRAAHAALTVEATEIGTAHGTGHQQALTRPLHHLMESARHRDVGNQHSSLIALFQAWDNTAETSIYIVSRFICSLRGAAKTSQKGRNGKRPRHKGDEFKLAAEWCDQQCITVPFRRDLYKIRNAIAHADYTIHESEVSFRNEDGTHLAAIDINELITVIEHDTLLAAHFANALIGAELRHLNRLGKFDEAWASAKSCIPDLEKITFDDGEHWPKRDKPQKSRNWKVRSFRPNPTRRKGDYDRYGHI